MSGELRPFAERAVEMARKAGADDAAVVASSGRSVSVQYRDGELEQVRESTSTQLGVSLYVDGRYSTHGTSDLRPDALEAFVKRAVEMTRLLQPDPHRGLADPALYEGRPDVDLDLEDPSWESLDIVKRKHLAEAAMQAAQAPAGPIISVTAGWSDGRSESVRVHSNGFLGERAGTRFGVGVEVSVQDEGDRKPESYEYASGRWFEDLATPGEVGAAGARRALARLGQKKLASAEMTLVVDNRVAGRLVDTFLNGIGGAALQQRQTFLLDKKGERVGGPLFTVVDDPFIPRGLASRTFDHDGLPARRRTLIEEGVLQDYLIDVYYGRKLGLAPTGGGTGNVLVPPGSDSPEALIARVPHGIWVTGLLGGNSDLPTGDFSHGLVGFEIRDGKIDGAVGEMNITGSHADLWNRLVAVGDDPYRYSSMRVPTLVFEGVSVSGS